VKSSYILTAALLSSLFALSAVPTLGQQNPAGLARSGTAKVSDIFSLQPPGLTQPGGLLGTRFNLSEKKRLLEVNEEELLAGFRHKPGKQAWIGEHVGKWLHAASLAYANTKDPALRAKLDRVASELIKTQGQDGYLGTYVPEKRWGLFPDADWDVWVHKYDLLGLLTYYQYTGNRKALDACRKVGDLLINTFGPSKKSIISAGTHVGMASTSVLEPVVLLYRATADPRYLDFAKYIVSSWEEPNGPHIISTLLREKSVRKTANAKAYEMTSNLNGLCELYRATGDKQYLEPVLIAWNDIVKNRLYLTGTGSSFEHWQDDYHLPNGNGANLGETCVTVTWEQLNIQLLRLTGNFKYADQLERSVYNHLLGAQKPTADAWCYYTPLEGTKPYGNETNCCLSSGPRGVALLPTFIYATTPDGVAVNLFTTSHTTARIPGGTVDIEQKTNYPLDGKVEFIINPRGGNKTFSLRLRVPAWTPEAHLQLNDLVLKNGYVGGSEVIINREWKTGDKLRYEMEMSSKLVLGDHENAGREAVMYGPLVLAADQAHNPNARTLTRVALATNDPHSFKLHLAGTGKEGEPIFDTEGQVRNAGGSLEKTTLHLTPFYAAGEDGDRFQVWLRSPGAPSSANESLFAFGDESRSRTGNAAGQITDQDPGTFVVTYDGTKKASDWFAVHSDTPVTINRVVFAHGRIYHDGGWFDTSGGKPQIQVQKEKNGQWENVAVLDTYPSANAVTAPRLRDGQAFTVKFPAIKVYGVRVVGKPASGDRPEQAFSSCAELQAYYDK
jgi:DUF1680 family protein